MPIVNGQYVTPCKTCKHKNTMTVFEPCWSCISNESLMTPKYGDSTYRNFEKEEVEDGGDSR